MKGSVTGSIDVNVNLLIIIIIIIKGFIMYIEKAPNMHVLSVFQGKKQFILRLFLAR